MLGGFKFAIHGGLRPVYRRPRFDYGEGLLSGPAWAGLLAVLSARRNALRAALGEGAVRYVMVGVLAGGLGVQVSTTPSVAQSAAKGHASPAHSSAARRAAVGGGPAAGILTLSESAGDHRANAGTAPAAAKPAPLGVGGGLGRRLPVPGMAAATAPDERIDLLNDIGLFDLAGAGGSNSSSGRPGNNGSGSSSNSGKPARTSSGLRNPCSLPLTIRASAASTIGSSVRFSLPPLGGGTLFGAGASLTLARAMSHIFQRIQLTGQTVILLH